MKFKSDSSRTSRLDRIGSRTISIHEPQGAAVPVQSALIEAIQSRCIVEFNDGGGYERIGEPHLLGICSETGTTQLEMFQTDGQKAKVGAQLPQWRRFTISEIWNLRTTAVEFTPRSEFDPRSLRWSRVIVSVNASALAPNVSPEPE